MGLEEGSQGPLGRRLRVLLLWQVGLRLLPHPSSALSRGFRVESRPWVVPEDPLGLCIRGLGFLASRLSWCVWAGLPSAPVPIFKDSQDGKPVMPPSQCCPVCLLWTHTWCVVCWGRGENRIEPRGAGGQFSPRLEASHLWLFQSLSFLSRPEGGHQLTADLSTEKISLPSDPQEAASRRRKIKQFSTFPQMSTLLVLKMF